MTTEYQERSVGIEWNKGPWIERANLLGDISEWHFEEWAKKNNLLYAKTGFAHAPFRTRQLPSFARFTPDFLIEDEADQLCWVECLGTRDEFVKLKTDKLKALQSFYVAAPRCVLFVWASHRNQYQFVKEDALIDGWTELTKERFGDGNEYIRVPLGPVWWTI